MTQLEFAKHNIISKQMREVAKNEQIPACSLKEKIRKGRVVIPFNKNHKPAQLCGIGEGLSTKVNVNLGTSTDSIDLNQEIKKLEIAKKHKADTVMDLSTGGNLRKIRKTLIKKSPLPFGTVPIYEAAVKAQNKYNSIYKMTTEDILETLRNHAEDGVDFFTVHCGVNKQVLRLLNKKKRIIDVVSRGGAILINWMKKNKEENPLFNHFDEVIDIAKEFDVTLSLGDGMRPGTILDATDQIQLKELNVLGNLAKLALKRGVQVIIEGPGHIPLHQIEKNMQLQKKWCNRAPFYVLGPLVTDVAPGYDHITSAIGGSLAAAKGADFLCFVTPAEHLKLPGLSDIKEGLIASRIAAHAADLAKGSKRALDWDKKISIARSRRDWKKQIELSIDPDKSRAFRKQSQIKTKDTCTMCGEYCSIKLFDEGLN